MSNSIWKTPDQKPESHETIAFYVDGYLFTSYYEPQYNQYGIFGASKVEKWCYMKELSSHIIALETELEQLEKENEAMREEFEVWHGNHKCVLEDNERLQKAVDYVYKLLLEEANFTAGAHLPNKYRQKIFEVIRQAIKENQ